MKRHKYIIISVLILLLIPCSAIAEEYTFEELLNGAMTSSPTIRTKIRELETIGLNIEIAQTDYNPKIGLSGNLLSVTADYQDKVSLNTTGNLSGSFKLPSGLETKGTFTIREPWGEKLNTRYSITLKYPIYPGKQIDSTHLQMKTLNNNLKKAQEDLEAKEGEVFIQVWKKFYSTLISRERIPLAYGSLKQAEDDLKSYQILLEKGHATKIDLLEKEVAYQRSLLAYEKSLQQYDNNLKDLLSYVGISQDRDVTLKGNLGDIQALKLILLQDLPGKEALLKDALSNSPSIRDAEMAIENAREELERTMLVNGPKVDLQFDYTSRDSKTTPTLPGRADDNNNWSIVLSGNYQFGDGGKVALERQKQMKNIDDLRRTYDEKEEAVTRQLETNLGNLRSAYLEYLTAKLEYERAQLEYGIREDEFKKGIISQEQLEAASRNLEGKELDLLQRHVDYQSLYWELNHFVYLKVAPYEVIE